MKTRKTGFVIGVSVTGAALALVTLTACPFQPPSDGPTAEPPIENTSPANCLKNIERSYNGRNVNLYKVCLSPNFVFYFNPNDIGTNPSGYYTIPDSWNYTEDWNATSNMFQDAYSIALTIPTSGIPDPQPGENSFNADNISIDLTVMETAGNGFKIGGGYCNFEFEKFKIDEGEDRWRVKNWWDNTHD
jgi:hypothetical protein